MNQKEWEELAEKARQAYDRAECENVDKEKLQACLDAFKDLYVSRKSKNEESYYRGNLIGTGRLEGTHEEVLGTVLGAIERTKIFISRSGSISPNQAGLYLRNLVNVLRKETFNDPVENTLSKYKEVLVSIARGHVA